MDKAGPRGPGDRRRRRHRRRVARRFAREGYVACVTRRRPTSWSPCWRRSAPMAARPTASARTPARKKRWSRWSSRSNPRSARSRCWCSTSAPTRPAASWRRPRGVLQDLGDGLLSGFLNAREVARRMVARSGPRAPPRHHPLHRRHRLAARFGANFAAFAGAKHALRALAQSMARELGPRGIHVAHVVIDGADRHRLHPRQFPRAVCAQGRRTAC
jgi:hypothetical protein